MKRGWRPKEGWENISLRASFTNSIHSKYYDMGFEDGADAILVAIIKYMKDDSSWEEIAWYNLYSMLGGNNEPKDNARPERDGD